MKNSIFSALMAIGLIAFSSCSEEEPQLAAQSDSTQINDKEIFPLTMKYKGVTYDVEATINNDSLVILDKLVSDIYNREIKDNHTLAVLAHKADDGHDIVEYYASKQELEEKNNLNFLQRESKTIIPTRETKPIDYNLAATTVGRAILYDDTDFKDRNVIIDIDKDYMQCIPSLGSYDSFNDKTSAIRVFNMLKPDKYYSPSTAYPGVYGDYGRNLRTCLIGYENSNYGGKVLYCVSKSYCAIDLAKLGTGVYHEDWKLGKIGWNDKISSVVFRIITTQNIADGEYPEHQTIPAN